MNSVSDEPAIFVEKACLARLWSEKAALIREARSLLSEPGLVDRWAYQLFLLRTDAGVSGWLAESLPHPAEALVKYLLFQGFYASTATDLREYAEGVLDDLDTPPPVPHHTTLYHNTAQDGHYM